MVVGRMIGRQEWVVDDCCYCFRSLSATSCWFAPCNRNSSHPTRGCDQEGLVSTGGAGLFYCFAAK